MPGHRPWSEIKRKTPDTPEARTRHQAAVAELGAEADRFEQTLAELRRAREFTQTTLGQALGVTQAQVSRIENQTDLYLSTLQNYLEAMGGHLELVGVFDDHEQRVTLAIGDLLARAPADQSTAATIVISNAAEEEANG